MPSSSLPQIGFIHRNAPDHLATTRVGYTSESSYCHPSKQTAEKIKNVPMIANISQSAMYAGQKMSRFSARMAEGFMVPLGAYRESMCLVSQ